MECWGQWAELNRDVRFSMPLKPEVLADGVNPNSIAARMTRARWSETRGGLNRKLVYEPLGLA